MVNAGAKAPHLVPRGLAPAQELHTPVLEKPAQELEARAVGAASSEGIEIVSGVERPRSLGLRPHRPGARLLSNAHLHPGGQPRRPHGSTHLLHLPSGLLLSHLEPLRAGQLRWDCPQSAAAPQRVGRQGGADPPRRDSLSTDRTDRLSLRAEGPS